MPFQAVKLGADYSLLCWIIFFWGKQLVKCQKHTYLSITDTTLERAGESKVFYHQIILILPIFCRNWSNHCGQPPPSLDLRSVHRPLACHLWSIKCIIIIIIVTVIKILLLLIIIIITIKDIIATNSKSRTLPMETKTQKNVHWKVFLGWPPYGLNWKQLTPPPDEFQVNLGQKVLTGAEVRLQCEVGRAQEIKEVDPNWQYLIKS